MVSVRAIVLAFTIVVFAVAMCVEGAYKKPPFNGSIFGKRSNTATDYEMIGRALNSMCESSIEMCNAWFMHQESN